MTRPEGNAPALEPGAAYVVVGGVENYQTTRALGFTLHGFKSTRRKMAQGVRPGDRLLFYLTGVKRFVAVATVTSTPFEDHAPIWSSAKKPGEDYPYRVRIRPERVLDPADGVDAEPLARRMAYTKKWPPEHWTLAFQGNLHRIPLSDAALIEGALGEAVAPHGAIAPTA